MAFNHDDVDLRTEKLRKIAELLKFVLTLNDDEIMKSTIESIIELLEEMS